MTIIKIHTINQWLYKKFIVERLNNIFGYLLLLSILSCVAFLSASSYSINTSLLFLVFTFALPLAIICFAYPLWGFFIALTYSSFIFLLQRILGDYPFSVGIDLLILISCLGLLNGKKQHLVKVSFNNSLNIVLMLWIVFTIIQFFNPNLDSRDDLNFNVKGLFIFILLYYLIYNISHNPAFIKIFIYSLVLISTLAAFYALYQEIFGLPSYDLKWVTSTQELIGLNFIGGRWRKWSFLSDCTAFGMFMAFSSIICIILILGPTKKRQKIILIIATLSMLFAMVFSGTRTAYAMIPAGISIYVLLTINQKRTIAFCIITLFALAAILFGPFYGPNINRLRTAFMPSEDASFDVREFNRSRIQPYIYSHPFGGGANTTGTFGLIYHPSHELAGFPPDSGYLKIALEYGWIGLILRFVLFTTILITGISNMLGTQNEMLKYIYLALISGFFSLTIAYFAQVSIFQYPTGIFVYAIYALMHTLKYADDQF